MMQRCTIMTCDEAVRHLPRIRAELVYRLVEERGVSQTNVASVMGLSRAAVSQYISRKRGAGNTPIPATLDYIIDAWADEIISGHNSITICDICLSLHTAPDQIDNSNV